MKKMMMLFLICIFLLTGCDETITSDNVIGENNSTEDNNVEVIPSEKYSIGDEIELCGLGFNIYKINDNELYLLAKNNITTTTFSDDEREQKYMHDYEGSLVECYVNEFVNNLENKGIIIQSSGIIDKDDLIELGFEIDGLNGTKYKISDAPNFIENEEHFWVDGYCRYDTYAWVYCNGILTTQKCEGEYGVRPVIVIEVSEIGKSK